MKFTLYDPTTLDINELVFDNLAQDLKLNFRYLK